MKHCTTHVQQERDKWIYENALIRKAKVSDAKILAPVLRKADLDEIQAAVGEPPEEVLHTSIRDSREKYSVLSLDEKAIYGSFGVCPLTTKVGAVWFLGSDDLFKSSKVSFLRNSKSWVDKLLENYEILCNVVDCRNKKHIQWLKWIGFTFADAPIMDFGYEGLPFFEFAITKGDIKYV